MRKMRKISQKELNNIIECHRNWLFDEDVPKSMKHRADLNDVDLSGLDLSYCNLNHADLSYSNLSGANLSNVNLCGAKLFYTDLHKVNLTAANLNSANLMNADLSFSELTDADLTYTILHNAELFNAVLINADLRGANLIGAILNKAILRGADLTHANLTNAKLIYTDLRGAKLSNANLYDTDVSDALGSLLEYRNGKILTEDIIGYKKCYDGHMGTVIVTLCIPRGAIVFSINGNKCRTNKVKVVAIDNADRAFSTYHKKDSDLYQKYLSYYVGDEITVYDFDCRYNVECSSGIHFFMTKEEAEMYVR